MNTNSLSNFELSPNPIRNRHENQIVRPRVRFMTRVRVWEAITRPPTPPRLASQPGLRVRVSRIIWWYCKDRIFRAWSLFGNWCSINRVWVCIHTGGYCTRIESAVAQIVSVELGASTGTGTSSTYPWTPSRLGASSVIGAAGAGPGTAARLTAAWD
jgi:hypothetical protein